MSAPPEVTQDAIGNWDGWAAQRPPAAGLHFDSAAAGRSATSVLAAVSDHALLEAQVGSYIAEEMAAPVIEAGRAALASLLGVPADGLAFVESATAALQTLLASWPFRVGDTIAVAPSEWGPALEAFAGHGLQVTELATVGDGQIDLEYLERLLRQAPPAIVHLTQVASHRGLVQPVAQAAVLCQAAGVPLWVDAAQALGHVDTALGADAVYSPGRKWLTAPRGVGVLAVAEAWWDRLAVRKPAMDPVDWPTVRFLESHDAHVAGRVGLSTAVRQFLDIGPAQVWRRLREVGQETREALGDLPGWQVAGPADAPSAITGLRPTAGQDLLAVRRQLLSEHGIVTTVARMARAPREMTQNLLRISPHVDCSAADLKLLRAALATG
ncbi:MAG: aminotransferase class V-fold PLP-dependent enzyme [Actinomycetota bacterium]